MAERTGSDLFLYSNYAYWAFDKCPDKRKFLFQFHPHAVSTQRLLAEDYERHPEVKWSFQTEADSTLSYEGAPERIDEWRLADRIVCASTFTKRTLVEQGCDPGRIAVIPYGVTAGGPDRFARRPTDRQKCRFLFVGQGVQRKGLHHLLKAWRQGHPEDCELLVIAKRMDPGIAALLDQPDVTYLAGVSHQDLGAYYGAADIFVMPSIVEGFGLVYLEALRAGLYCIGTPNTGLPDLGLSDQDMTNTPVGDLDRLGATIEASWRLWKGGHLDKDKISQAVEALSWERFRHRIADLVKQD
jgi:glycosyltransferase involved in cell wall biosynthesis